MNLCERSILAPTPPTATFRTKEIDPSSPPTLLLPMPRQANRPDFISTPIASKIPLPPPAMNMSTSPDSNTMMNRETRVARIADTQSAMTRKSSRDRRSRNEELEETSLDATQQSQALEIEREVNIFEQNSGTTNHKPTSMTQGASNQSLNSANSRRDFNYSHGTIEIELCEQNSKDGSHIFSDNSSFPNSNDSFTKLSRSTQKTVTLIDIEPKSSSSESLQTLPSCIRSIDNSSARSKPFSYPMTGVGEILSLRNNYFYSYTHIPIEDISNKINQCLVPDKDQNKIVEIYDPCAFKTPTQNFQKVEKVVNLERVQNHFNISHAEQAITVTEATKSTSKPIDTTQMHERRLSRERRERITHSDNVSKCKISEKSTHPKHPLITEHALRYPKNEGKSEQNMISQIKIPLLCERNQKEITYIPARRNNELYRQETSHSLPLLLEKKLTNYLNEPTFKRKPKLTSINQESTNLNQYKISTKKSSGNERVKIEEKCSKICEEIPIETARNIFFRIDDLENGTKCSQNPHVRQNNFVFNNDDAALKNNHLKNDVHTQTSRPFIEKYFNTKEPLQLFGETPTLIKSRTSTKTQSIHSNSKAPTGSLNNKQTQDKLFISVQKLLPGMKPLNENLPCNAGLPRKNKTLVLDTHVNKSKLINNEHNLKNNIHYLTLNILPQPQRNLITSNNEESSILDQQNLKHLHQQQKTNDQTTASVEKPNETSGVSIEEKYLNNTFGETRHTTVFSEPQSNHKVKELLKAENEELADLSGRRICTTNKCKSKMHSIIPTSCQDTMQLLNIGNDCVRQRDKRIAAPHHWPPPQAPNPSTPASLRDATLPFPAPDPTAATNPVSSPHMGLAANRDPRHIGCRSHSETAANAAPRTKRASTSPATTLPARPPTRTPPKGSVQSQHKHPQPGPAAPAARTAARAQTRTEAIAQAMEGARGEARAEVRARVAAAEAQAKSGRRPAATAAAGQAVIYRRYLRSARAWRPGNAPLVCPACGRVDRPAPPIGEQKTLTFACFNGCWPLTHLMRGSPNPLRLYCRECGHYLGAYDAQIGRLTPAKAPALARWFRPKQHPHATLAYPPPRLPPPDKPVTAFRATHPLLSRDRV